MSAKHTPGPWSAIYPEERVFYAGTDITSYDVVSEKTRLQLREEGRAHYDRVHEDVANVAIVSTHFWRDMSDEEAKANACLIAAAPELLEALTEIVAAADGDGWKQLDATFAAARAAIAKATHPD